ncbi:MAG: sulfotransferase family 2 domain-containing protein [Octadecabacter sp.]|nr:sulfotransferase family 2 domain-containing protein [Octadecabacter sp.]
MGNFDYFVIFSEMRTGSNFLETNLNAFDGLTCHGEAYNPYFIGYPNQAEILGLTLESRNANPLNLLTKIRVANGINGFRYFNDHDPRVFDTVMGDRGCAKIILTRNPVESYVSWKIANATGQWKLTNLKRLRDDTVTFNAAEFYKHITKLQAFQVRLLNTLQKAGQVAFYVDYEDLQDVDVINGLAEFIGVDERLKSLDTSLKKQNPSALSDKVKNFGEMKVALAQLDLFNLSRTPNFEPRRGPLVPSYFAAASSPLMYLPIKSGPVAVVLAWLAELDGVRPKDLLSNFTQKTLRHWKRQRPGHRCFTVVRHPVARAHAAFCSKILSTGEGSFPEIRAILCNHFKLIVPAKYPDQAYTSTEHRAAFLVFLKFVKLNIASQTVVRVDAHWSTQSQLVQGFAKFASPDLILREDRLKEDFSILAAQIGITIIPQTEEASDPYIALLQKIYDDEVEAAVHDVYQRDYVTFGFGSYA